MSKIRAFIAIELPESVRADIGDLQKSLAASGLKLRWVKPQNIHLTLKFLGDAGRETIGDFCDSIAAAAANYEVFDIRPRGVGCFPGVKNPRVIWVGLSGDLDVLGRLQADVEADLIPLGFKPEKRPFRGHLTIGRIKGGLNPKKLADRLRTHTEFATDVFRVTHVVLFQSILQPAGPEYTPLCKIPLGAA